ncbi:MAG TPA: hypothetical protein PKY56_10505 [Candidatus Kapabacteria bacterium]|nr:hypothetical protein [Candidatus Kapabacteria bacterium]HPO63774.1 hypothetical protein [Candidatus Kapabacteria bacterium]
MKKALLLLFVLLIVACGSDSPSSPSKTAYDTINGEWKITFDGKELIYNITAGKNYCYFLGNKYDGIWGSNAFTGSFVMYNQGVRYDNTLKLTLVDENTISGYWVANCIINNQGYYYSSDISGKRN